MYCYASIGHFFFFFFFEIYSNEWTDQEKLTRKTSSTDTFHEVTSDLKIQPGIFGWNFAHALGIT